MPYRFRHVVNNQHTIDEGDDTVFYFDTLTGNPLSTGNTLSPEKPSTPSTAPKTLVSEADMRQEIFVARLLKGTTSEIVKLYNPSRHLGPENAQCIFSQSLENLRSFLNWVNQKPSERTAFEKNGTMIYQLVDKTGKEISFSDDSKLRPSVVQLNYEPYSKTDSDSKRDIVKQCSNLNQFKREKTNEQKKKRISY